jgi:hypothetical protein
MKKIIPLLLILMIGHCAIAQSDTIIYLSVTDLSVIESVQQNANGTVTPVFSNPAMNSIAANYTFKTFMQGFPDSRFLFLRQVYKVIASSTAVAGDLANAFPVSFLVVPDVSKAHPEPPINAVLRTEFRELNLKKITHSPESTTAPIGRRISRVSLRTETFPQLLTLLLT